MRGHTAAASGLLSIALGGIGTGGCAFGDRFVQVTYPPPPSISIAAPTNTIEPLPGFRGLAVALQDFTDKRPKPEIGEVRNAFGMHTAHVKAMGNVERWVTEAVAYELDAAGLRVRRLEGLRPRPGELVISGQVTTFYCRSMFTYEAEVSFLGIAARDGRVDFNAVVVGTGSSGVNLAMTEQGYGESLSAALQDAARKFVKQIYPIVTRRAPRPPPPAAPVDEGDPPSS